jgi:Amt family ammonium transporter
MAPIQTALAIVSLLIAPLAPAGLALMNAGLGRLRNAAHAMMAALCAVAAAACAYCVLGRSIEGGPGAAAHVLLIGGRPWDWLGAMPLLFSGTSSDPGADLAGWMGLLGASFTALIPAGSGADRWRLAAVSVSSAILGGLTFPLFAHWTWGGGWLAQLGYQDPGGAGVIHALGGMTALAITWILGARRGKYGSGMPMAIPGHNAVFVLFGCLLSLVGWLGWNMAGSLIFLHADLVTLPKIAVNTLLSAAAAALATAAVTRYKYTKPDATLTANGWTAGLVASSAVCGSVAPAAALLIGLIAGASMTFAVELLDLHLEIDDPGGSIPVHALGGLWGLLALGLFGHGSLLAQVVGTATLVGFTLPIAWGLNALVNLRLQQRVAAEGENQGMDLYELGAGAYPEFVTHDDYSLR